MNRITTLVEQNFGGCDISSHYRQIAVIDERPLHEAVPLSRYVLGSRDIEGLIKLLGFELDFAVFGWIDQAILEVSATASGGVEVLERLAPTLDTYGPDQNGDLMLVIASRDWIKLIAVEASFETGRVTLVTYEKHGV